MTIDGTECRPVPRPGGYLAGIDGHIYDSHGCEWLTEEWPAFDHHWLYILVRVPEYRKRQLRRVHHMVCLAWHGEPDVWHHFAHHRNGDHADCRPDNLEWRDYESLYVNRRVLRPAKREDKNGNWIDP